MALPSRADRTLLVGVDPDSDHPGFSEELFGPIYLTTDLPGTDPAEFLANAVAFANNRLHGNLGANILIHPATAKALGPQLEQAVADLRYGCIGGNVWAAAAFIAPRTARAFTRSATDLTPTRLPHIVATAVAGHLQGPRP